MDLPYCHCELAFAIVSQWLPVRTNGLCLITQWRPLPSSADQRRSAGLKYRAYYCATRATNTKRRHLQPPLMASHIETAATSASVDWGLMNNSQVPSPMFT